MDVARRIIEAYPTALAGEAAVVAATMIARAATLSPNGFRVVVAGQVVTVPERLYVDRLPALKMNGPAVACLLTRHYDGFVRQRALSQILRVNAEWSIPFVVRLAGEYVMEIIAEIEERFAELPSDHMGAFVRANSDFIRLTRARVISYWNCYFRHIPRQDYVALRLMDRIEAAA